MKSRVVAALFAAAALCLAAGVTTAVAGSSTTNGTSHCNPSDPLCGANPLLTGPPPPFVSIQGSCPAFLTTDAWNLNFVDGNAVSHGTLNKNGDWGGFTAEGPAVLTSSDGTVAVLRARHRVGRWGPELRSWRSSHESERGWIHAPLQRQWSGRNDQHPRGRALDHEQQRHTDQQRQ